MNFAKQTSSPMRQLRSSKPTICHVLHSMNVGGAELLASQFARHTADTFRPVFVCLDEIGSLGERLREQGFSVMVGNRSPGLDIGCAWRIGRFMKEQGVQVVHAHQYAPFFYASMARHLTASYRIVFTEHGRDYPDFRRPKRVLANRILLRDYDRVVAVGNQVKAALVDNEGIPEERVEVIYNGVDLKNVGRDYVQRSEVRAELGLNENQIAVVQVARLNRLKDFSTAIAAMKTVIKASPNVRYVIVGDGEERPVIQQQILEAGLGAKVNMLGMRSDVTRLLKGMDVFLLTSISEGIPLTLIEAMLSGLPCVSTSVGGVPEVVVDEESGLLAPAKDAHAIAAQVLRLSRSPALRQRLGHGGIDRASKRFSATQMLEQYDRLYEQMIEIPALKPPRAYNETTL